MEQTKNEPKNENKAAPDNGKPKKERKPLTEAQSGKSTQSSPLNSEQFDPC